MKILEIYLAVGWLMMTYAIFETASKKPHLLATFSWNIALSLLIIMAAWPVSLGIEAYCAIQSWRGKGI